MKSRTAIDTACLLIATLLLTLPGVNAHHGPTRTVDYLDGVIDQCPEDCPEDTNDLQESIESDQSTINEPQVGEKYTIELGRFHLLLLSIYSDREFRPGNLTFGADFENDADGDGYYDLLEVFSCESNPINKASSCRDPDADGLIDTNGDNSEEYDGLELRTHPRSRDNDGDGYSDGEEARATGPSAPYDPLDPTSNPGLDQDQDGDDIADYYDNCPASANPYQQDTDRDGVGDSCEHLIGPMVPGNGCSFTWSDFSCYTLQLLEERLPTREDAVKKCSIVADEEPCDDPQSYFYEEASDCYRFDLMVGICYGSGFGTGWVIRIGEDQYAV